VISGHHCRERRLVVALFDPLLSYLNPLTTTSTIPHTMHAISLLSVAFLAFFHLTVRSSPISSNSLIARCPECDGGSPAIGFPSGSPLGGGSGLPVLGGGAPVAVSGAINAAVQVLPVGSLLTGSGPSLPVGGSPAPVHGHCNWQGCNENDVWDWANGLSVKIHVILGRLDGKNDPHQPCLDLISEIEASVAALVKIDIDTTKQQGSKCGDIAKLIAYLLIDIAIALSKYGAATLGDVCGKLDTTLHALLQGLDAHIYGFAGLCGSSLTHIQLFVQINLKLTLQACGY